MAEEKDIFARLVDEFVIIDRRATLEDAFIENTIKEMQETAGEENVRQSGASISIIEGSGQLLDSPDPVALVISLKALDLPSYVVVPADPYNLLNLAHKILEKLDPSKA